MNKNGLLCVSESGAALSSKNSPSPLHSLLERARSLLKRTRTRSARGLRSYSESWQARAAFAVYAATVSHGRHGMHSRHGRHGRSQPARPRTGGRGGHSGERPALGRAQTQTLRASRRASQCKTPKIALKGLEKAESSHPSKPTPTRLNTTAPNVFCPKFYVP